MSERFFVYNPADPDFKRLSFTYNGKELKLAPNAVNEIASPWKIIASSYLLEICIGQLGRFGVMRVAGETATELEIEESEAKHSEYLRETHGAVLEKHHATAKLAADLGLAPPAESADVKRSKAKLAEWGLLITALFLFLCGVVSAQSLPVQAPRVVTALYDLDSTSETFPILEATARNCDGRIQTSGSSTTVTAAGAATTFTDIAIGDQLVNIGNPVIVNAKRTVMARASATSITVNSAINIGTGGANCKWAHLTDGTAVTNGWFETNRRPFTLDFAIVQMAVTGGIDVRIQCAVTEADGTIRPRQVYPVLTPPTSTASYTNFTAAGGFSLQTEGIWDRCRVGMKIGSADDGGDLTTNQEQITIAVEFGVR